MDLDAVCARCALSPALSLIKYVKAGCRTANTATNSCATEVAYIKELCRDFNIDLDTVPIMEDNTACIALSANPVHHQRTKHIAKYYHYCRDLVLAGEIELVGVGTKYQVADIFTKPLERDTFRRLSSVLNGYRSYAQLLVDAPTASIATMLQKTSDYANQVYHSLADHDLARYV